MPHDVTLTGATALVAPRLREKRTGAAAGAGAQARREPQREVAVLAVEVASGARLAEVRADWLDLVGRADAPNVFMNPTLVRLAGEAYPDGRSRALLAWQDVDGRRRLVGVWAFAIAQAPRSIVPLSVLSAPPVTQAYLATPVIDRGTLDQTLDAMLERIANDPELPKIVALDAMSADGASMQALTRVLAARGSVPCIFGQSSRPRLASDLGGKQYLEKALSSSTRKKLRQHRRRLSEKGALESRIIGAPDALRDALDDFLKIEASGWKGRQGTALSSNPADATFARTMVCALAADGDACIHALYLDGRPVSMQLVLRAGPAAFTWKTAYDETLQDVSPGMLLLEDYTTAFLADRSIEFVDSCAYDDSGYMAAWSERQTIAHLWLDARRGGSLAFTMLTRLQKAYLALRAAAKSAYLAGMRRRAR